jgi:peroxiredoxin
MITSDFSNAIRIGQHAPGFRLTATDGTTVALADVHGPTVVFFTCNHCPYVIGWEGRLRTLAEAFADRVRFLGINANDATRYPDDSFAKMVERANKGLPYAYLHDPTQEIARAWGAQVTPEFFVLDADHVVAYHGRLDASHTDPKHGGEPELRQALEAVLAGRSPSPAETPVQGCSIKWFL